MKTLVVEDEPKVASFIQSGLAQNGIQAEVCHHGDEALQRIKNETFDAVVLDIMLLGRDGLSILRHARAGGCNVPIILLTARGDLDERVEGLNLGADDYLAKPFAITELVARLRAVWRRQQGVVANVLAYDTLAMNLAAREVRRDGNLVQLTQQEFALLERLLRTPEKIVTRTEICQHVWGYQFDPGTNIVEVAVQRLRKKIDGGGAAQGANGASLIRTVRGVGYVLKNTP